MKVFKLREQVKSEVKKLKAKGMGIGLVPTMGALHHGHGSIVKSALLENDVVFVSIFVNPTQFDNKIDLKNYPRTLEEDLNFLKLISPDLYIYAPPAEDIYAGKVRSNTFSFNGLDTEMEGKYRKGHFNGVGTVVKLLLELIQPDRAYFGEKDFQQLSIIKHIVQSEGIPVEIIGHPIFREDDGLAMSSRNRLLNQKERSEAHLLYKTLQKTKEKFGTDNASDIASWVKQQFADSEILKLEYFVIADAETLKPVQTYNTEIQYRAFIAAYAGNVRLIDNIALN